MKTDQSTFFDGTDDAAPGLQGEVAEAIRESAQKAIRASSSFARNSWDKPTLAEAAENPFALLLLAVTHDRPFSKDEAESLSGLFRRQSVEPSFQHGTDAIDIKAARLFRNDLDRLCLGMLNDWRISPSHLKTVRYEDFDRLAERGYHLPLHYELRAKVARFYEAGGSNEAFYDIRATIAKAVLMLNGQIAKTQQARTAPKPLAG